MFWPVVFGIDTNFNSASADYIRKLIDSSMPGWTETNWTLSAASNGFWDASIGYFFSMSNNAVFQNEGKKQARSALSVSFHYNSTDPASYIADAGWLLLNLQVITDSANKNNYILYVN
jgi:hypothetical protein